MSLNAAQNPYTFITTVKGKKVPVGYSKYPADFKPEKSTIVYLSGGPSFSSDLTLPKGYPENFQVLVIDYAGTSFDDRAMPAFTHDQIMKGFTNENQANVVRNIIKKENLSNYILNGESHGVQLAMRAINKIQRDQGMIYKPVAAILDSGMGRRINAQDVIERDKRCGIGDSHKDRSASTPVYVESYLRDCHYRNLTDAEKSGLVTRLVHWLSPSAVTKENMSTKYATELLRKHFGCPPMNKISPVAWTRAMGCGVFEEGIDWNRSCSDLCPKDIPKKKSACLKKCAKSPNNLKCQDIPLDVKNYKMGETKILAIQSLDDCINWVSSMDYLVSNLKKNPDTGSESAEAAYVRVQNAGGHVTFRTEPSFAKCRAPHMGNYIYKKIFEGDLTSAKTTIVNCYHESSVPNGTSTSSTTK